MKRSGQSCWSGFEQMNATQQLPIFDLLALALFLTLWIGYVVYTKHINLNKHRGLLAAMNRVRYQWVKTLLARENRMVDSQVINGLISKETFFASTTLLILASIIALLGMGDQVNQLFHEIPFAQQTTLGMLELKVSMLAMTFVYAFFKFTWAIRQHSSCAILVASIALPDKVDAEAEKQANRLAKLSNLAARHFNDGMRAYYFALAELSWFFHPVAFIAATLWVIVVLYRREFYSKALTILE
jgi:uncharacterized membrane protein